uniref:NADH dehydrogenase subunit 2 n=1 Tax=Ogmocotyle sp. JM-2015 TaxID=1651255 RepID=A0A0F7G5T8_9TREM|nr:NADH dehydrogenase subunit 2 [Ogmocotyle sp. JM-2015]
MRGFLISFLSVCGVVLFSVVMFFSSNLCLFWLYLELSSLCLVPAFFLSSESDKLNSLFSYIVASSIASSLILCGVLFTDLMPLMILGFLIKFGLFPFFGWVYNVIVGSNWLAIWGLSTALKASFFFFSFFLSCNYISVVSWLSAVTFLFCGSVFWIISYNWYYCWSHMMLVSSASLVVMSLVISLDYLAYLYVIYVVWATAVICFFEKKGGDMSLDGVGLCFMFCSLLVSFPCSISVFYKLVIGGCVFSCYFPVFVCWVFYNISEQFYLVKMVIGQEIPKEMGGLFNVV